MHKVFTVVKFIYCVMDRKIMRKLVISFVFLSSGMGIWKIKFMDEKLKV